LLQFRFLLDWLTDIHQQFKTLFNENMIDIENARHELNHIPLCTSCHASFDHKTWFDFEFLPIDMVFFYSWEVRDRKARLQRLREDGVRIPRTCPTQADYKQHQISQGYPEEYAGMYVIFSERSFGDTGLLVTKDFHYEIPSQVVIVNSSFRVFDISPMLAIVRTSCKGFWLQEHPVKRHYSQMLRDLLWMLDTEIDSNQTFKKFPPIPQTEVPFILDDIIKYLPKKVKHHVCSNSTCLNDTLKSVDESERTVRDWVGEVESSEGKNEASDDDVDSEEGGVKLEEGPQSGA
jgi:hypothetical protein